jgi:hypothetical protein
MPQFSRFTRRRALVDRQCKYFVRRIHYPRALRGDSESGTTKLCIDRPLGIAALALVLALLGSAVVATQFVAQSSAASDAAWPAFELTYREVAGTDALRNAHGVQRYRYTQINDRDWAFATLTLPAPPEPNGRIGPGPGSIITVENSSLTTTYTEPDPAGGPPRVSFIRHGGREGFSDWSHAGYVNRVLQQPGAVRHEGLPADATLSADVAVPWPIGDVMTVVTPEPRYCQPEVQNIPACAPDSQAMSIHVFTKSHGIVLQRYMLLDGRVVGGMFAESLHLR